MQSISAFLPRKCKIRGQAAAYLRGSSYICIAAARRTAQPQRPYSFIIYTHMKPLRTSLLLLRSTAWAAAFACSLTAAAQKKFVDRSTDALCLLPSATGLVKAWLDDDRAGMKQWAITSATTLAANYAIEALIEKDRPDGSGHHAFPSTHSAAAFNGATFLCRRYGWKWGVPAYAVAGYVAWGRVYAKKHDGWDVAGGALLGAASGLLLTRPFARKANLTLAPAAWGRDAAGIYCAWQF